jgi:hypothetical protein
VGYGAIEEREATSDRKQGISNAFQAFLREAPHQASAWGGIGQSLAEASSLDAKTSALAYLAVPASLGLECGALLHTCGQSSQRHTR